MRAMLFVVAMGINGYAAEKASPERGRDALLGQAFVSPVAGRNHFDALWRLWGLKEKPADFASQVRERYGLHEAPFLNAGLPMGLREVKTFLNSGVANDCLLCHAGSIGGKTVIGLGNSSLDLQGLFDDLAAAQGMKPASAIPFSNVRGTSEASAAAAYLFQFRNPDLSMRQPNKLDFTTSACEDVPAWWLMKKKTTMYATGSHSSRSVRSLMAFLLTPFNTGEYIKRQEPTFRDIQAYLLTLEPPKYPFPIDAKAVAHGQALFEKTCSRCHGTYGEKSSYPNKVIDLDALGTDPTLATGFPAAAEELYNQSWFGEEIGPEGKKIPAKANRGYQAPPLDGIWATAPYLHNGSVPTLRHVLDSKARPKIFTRSYRTTTEDYDTTNVGWKSTLLQKGADPKLAPSERRKIYDTTQPGRSNGGHTYGDKLTDEERAAIIEYLKTL